MGIPAAKKENKALIIESPRGLLSVKEVCEYTGLSEKNSKIFVDAWKWING